MTEKQTNARVRVARQGRRRVGRGRHRHPTRNVGDLAAEAGGKLLVAGTLSSAALALSAGALAAGAGGQAVAAASAGASPAIPVHLTASVQYKPASPSPWPFTGPPQVIAGSSPSSPSTYANGKIAYQNSGTELGSQSYGVSGAFIPDGLGVYGQYATDPTGNTNGFVTLGAVAGEGASASAGVVSTPAPGVGYIVSGAFGPGTATASYNSATQRVSAGYSIDGVGGSASTNLTDPSAVTGTPTANMSVGAALMAGPTVTFPIPKLGSSDLGTATGLTKDQTSALQSATGSGLAPDAVYLGQDPVTGQPVFCHLGSCGGDSTSSQAATPESSNGTNGSGNLVSPTDPTQQPTGQQQSQQSQQSQQQSQQSQQQSQQQAQSEAQQTFTATQLNGTAASATSGGSGGTFSYASTATSA